MCGVTLQDCSKTLVVNGAPQVQYEVLPSEGMTDRQLEMVGWRGPHEIWRWWHRRNPPQLLMGLMGSRSYSWVIQFYLSCRDLVPSQAISLVPRPRNSGRRVRSCRLGKALPMSHLANFNPCVPVVCWGRTILGPRRVRWAQRQMWKYQDQLR